MIGFGFTIYNFFRYLPEDIASGRVQRPQAPRNLGMSLIALGTLTLAAAAWQHRHFLAQIGASDKQHMWSLAFIASIAVIRDRVDRVLWRTSAE